MLPALLDPRTVFVMLNEIDQTPPSFTGSRRDGARTTLVVLLSVCVSLLILNYVKNYDVFERVLILLAQWRGYPSNYWVQVIEKNGWQRLLLLAWWSGTHLVTFVLIPWLVVTVFLKVRMRELGWGWGETHRHWVGYAYLLTPILFMVFIASHRQDFLAHYPFYRDAGRSYFDFFAWQALYLLQFACLEFFFRGYIVNTLRPYYGSAAIWIMVVPYLMLHFDKPWLESTGAIFFGLFLAILAVRSRSIWGGFLVHAGVAVSMDIASLVQQGNFPDRWWPAL